MVGISQVRTLGIPALLLFVLARSPAALAQCGPDSSTPMHTCPCGGPSCGECDFSCLDPHQGPDTRRPSPDTGRSEAIENQQSQQTLMLQQSMQFGAQIGAQIGTAIRQWLDREAELGQQQQRLEQHREFVKNMESSVTTQEDKAKSAGANRTIYCNMLFAKAQRLGAEASGIDCAQACPKVPHCTNDYPVGTLTEERLEVVQTELMRCLHTLESVGNTLDHQCKIAVMRLGTALSKTGKSNVFMPSEFPHHLDDLSGKRSSPEQAGEKLKRLEQENEQLKRTIGIEEENRKLKEELLQLEQRQGKQEGLGKNVFDPSHFSEHLEQLDEKKATGNGAAGQSSK